MSVGQILGPGAGKVIELPGVTAVFKVVNDRKPGDFVVLEVTAQPSFTGPGPHLHHTHEELFYVLDGEFDFFVDSEVRRVGPGSFVNVPPGVMHDYRNPGPGPARFLGIACPAGLDRYFEEIRDLIAAGNIADVEELRRVRLRFNTVEPEDAPPGHWAEQR
jgi:mannose-6-phosphate isomerase-like protein (cupin superfamily)